MDKTKIKNRLKKVLESLPKFTDPKVSALQKASEIAIEDRRVESEIDYSKNDFRNSIIFLVLAGIYFLSPLDIIPDFAPFLAGYLDDATILGFVVPNFIKHLKRYLVFRETKKNNIGGE